MAGSMLAKGWSTDPSANAGLSELPAQFAQTTTHPAAQPSSIMPLQLSSFPLQASLAAGRTSLHGPQIPPEQTRIPAWQAPISGLSSEAHDSELPSVHIGPASTPASDTLARSIAESSRTVSAGASICAASTSAAATSKGVPSPSSAPSFVNPPSSPPGTSWPSAGDASIPPSASGPPGWSASDSVGNLGSEGRSFALTSGWPPTSVASLRALAS